MSKPKQLIEKRRDLFMELAAMEPTQEISLHFSTYEAALSERAMIYRAFAFLRRTPDYEPLFTELKTLIKASVTQDRHLEIVFTRHTSYQITRRLQQKKSKALPRSLKEDLFFRLLDDKGGILTVAHDEAITEEMLLDAFALFRQRDMMFPMFSVKYSHCDDESGQDVWNYTNEEGQ